MRRALVLCLLAACAAPAGRPQYPSSFRGPDVDNYFGTFVEDPYRWLEDPDSPDTRRWVAAQNAMTFAFLDKIPERKAIRQRLEEVYRFERRSSHQRRGDLLFYKRNEGLQNQFVLWVARADGSAPRVLIDPNTLSSDGTVSLQQATPSPDGSKIAWASSAAGSDWEEWHVRDVATGKDTTDLVRWSKFGRAAWLKDGSGFFYARYPEPKGGNAGATDALVNHQIWFHRLGTPQSADTLTFSLPEHPEWFVDAQVTEDGRWLVLTTARDSNPLNLVSFRSLERPDAPIVPIITEWKGQYSFLGGEKDAFYFQTNVGSPRGRIVRFDPQGKETTLVPEGPDALEGAMLCRGHILVQRLHDVTSQLVAYHLDGSPAGQVALPPLVSASWAESSLDEDEPIYGYEGFAVPPRTLAWNPTTGESRPIFAAKPAFDETRFETRQVFYPSKDGTKIPMFLTYEKGLALDGSAPTLLYGYGGFAVNETPYFWAGLVPWLERGGVYAVANLRGGAEYGEAWHQAGMLGKKQTVFDDFIAAAEYLVAEKITSRRRLAINGGSNGGLLVGAVVTQHPELFGAAIADVGVMDMLRYHKFTIGRAWVGEYGSSDDPAQFKWLHAYSPLHNVKMSSHYPPTLLLTGDHDDRVVPAHSYKLAAAMQTAQAAINPILIRIQTRTGHGSGKPLSLQLDEQADKWAFLVEVFR